MESLENEAVSAFLTRMERSRQPMILMDGFAARFGVRNELNGLVRLTGISTLTTPFGKSLVDEPLPNFHGVFSALSGDPDHAAWVKTHDLALHFGPLRSDANTYGFIASPERQVTILIEKTALEMFEAPKAAPSSCIIRIESFLDKTIQPLKQTHFPSPEQFPPNLGHPGSS